jgi:hypothetical protein
MLDIRQQFLTESRQLLLPLSLGRGGIGHLAQQCYPALACQFTNRTALLDLLTQVQQKLNIFVVKFAIAIPGPLWLE